MTWTNFPCIPKWTLTDNEATGFDVLEAGSVFLLSVTGFPLLYGTVVNPLTVASFTARLFSDEDKTTEVIVGDYTGQSYILSRFSAWIWSPLLFDDTIDPEGIGTFRSRPVELYIPGGKLVGIWIATLRLDGTVETRFKGVFTPFALAVLGLQGQAFTDTGTLAAGTYTYFVAAVNSGGFEGGASWIDVTLGATGRIVLTWLPTPNAVSYNIYKDCQLLKSGVLVTTYEDGGQAFEDPGIEPDPEPDPEVAPPDDPPVTVDPGDDGDDPPVIIIDDDEDGEDDVIETITPDVVVTDDGNDCENVIYTDIDGNDVVVTKLGGVPVTFERLGSGRWAEEDSLVLPPVKIEDLYDIDGEIAPPDYTTIIGPPVSWADLLGNNSVSGVYKISLKETIGVTYPCDINVQVTSNDFTLNDAVLTVHYNTDAVTVATVDVGDNETDSTFSLPYVFGIRAIEKSFGVGYTDIRNVYTLTTFAGESVNPGIPNPITINAPLGPTSRLEITDWDRPASINMRITQLNSPGAGVVTDIWAVGGWPSGVQHVDDLSQAASVKTFTIVDATDYFTNIMEYAQPATKADIDITIEIETAAIPTDDVTFEVKLNGVIFNLLPRDSTGSDVLKAPCIDVTYIDTYVPPGENPRGTREETLTADETDPVRATAIQTSIDRIKQALFSPDLEGYAVLGSELFGGVIGSVSKRKKTKRGGDGPPIPNLSFPFIESTRIIESNDSLSATKTSIVPKPLGDAIKSGLV